jgi:hypothetical protein
MEMLVMTIPVFKIFDPELARMSTKSHLVRSLREVLARQSTGLLFFGGEESIPLRDKKVKAVLLQLLKNGEKIYTSIPGGEWKRLLPRHLGFTHHRDCDLKVVGRR